MVFLQTWEERHRSGAEIETETEPAPRRRFPGAVVRARMQSPFQRGGGGGGGGASIVLLGLDYEQLAATARSHRRPAARRSRVSCARA